MAAIAKEAARAAGGRLRAKAGDDAARLLDELQRGSIRAEATLAAAQRAEAEGDRAAAAAARHRAVGLVDELQRLCGRLRQAQSGIAEALLLSGRLRCALAAYRQPHTKGP